MAGDAVAHSAAIEIARGQAAARRLGEEDPQALGAPRGRTRTRVPRGTRTIPRRRSGDGADARGLAETARVDLGTLLSTRPQRHVVHLEEPVVGRAVEGALPAAGLPLGEDELVHVGGDETRHRGQERLVAAGVDVDLERRRQAQRLRHRGRARQHLAVAAAELLRERARAVVLAQDARDVRHRRAPLAGKPAEVAAGEGSRDEPLGGRKLAVEVQDAVGIQECRVHQRRRVAHRRKLAVLAGRHGAPPREVRVGAHAAARHVQALVDEVARAAVDRLAREGTGKRRPGGLHRIHHRVARRERCVHVGRVAREELGEARLEKESLADRHLRRILPLLLGLFPGLFPGPGRARESDADRHPQHQCRRQRQGARPSGASHFGPSALHRCLLEVA